MPCIYKTRKQKPSQEHIDVATDIIAHFGGPCAFSKKLAWNRNYVHGWVRGHYFLPFERAEQIESLSDGKWSVIDIRPDLKILQKYFKCD